MYFIQLIKTQSKKSNPVDVIAVTKGWNLIKRRERHLNKDVIFKYYQAVLDYEDELNLGKHSSLKYTSGYCSIYHVHRMPQTRSMSQEH